MVPLLQISLLLAALVLAIFAFRSKNRHNLVALLDFFSGHRRRRQRSAKLYMAPTVTFVRHAQGFHNLNVANHQLRDPLLTPFGQQQCAHLNKTFPHHQNVDLIVASPLKRTIYTALESFPDTIAKKKLVIIALPEVQETSDLPCDTGSDVSELKREFAGKPVNFDLVHEGWYSKQGPWAPRAPEIEERCKVARHWLRARPEKNIVVVTHGGVLHYLTEDWQDMNRFQEWENKASREITRNPSGYLSRGLVYLEHCILQPTGWNRSNKKWAADFLAGTGWANTEFRSYHFDSKNSDAHDQASLIETEESRTRRRGTEKPLTEAEHRNLKRTTSTDGHGGAHQKSPSSSTQKIPAKV